MGAAGRNNQETQWEVKSNTPGIQSRKHSTYTRKKPSKPDFTENKLTQKKNTKPLLPGAGRAAGTRTVAAPFTCTDLLAVVVRAEGSLSTLEVSLCFSTTLGSL